MKLSGWGRYPVAACRVTAPRDEDAVRATLRDGPLIARGNGRAYGDSALNTGNTVSMRRFNRMIAFDENTGQLTAEAGVLIQDIIAAFLHRGWFPSVTPGTKFVTLGGAIAADVHGKNHHVDGSFGNFVDWVDVMGPDGKVRRASPRKNSALFEWTIGSMGLTGVILRAAIGLRPVSSGWMRQITLPAPNLDAVMAEFEAEEEAPYSVAWIDCLSRGDHLGRSILMLGEHAKREDLSAKQAAQPFGPVGKPRFGMPFDAPGFALNRFTVGAFNSVYYHLGARRAGTGLVDWNAFFYPLDGVLGWNRIYGRRGFLQFQCVLPLDTAREGLTELLETISAARQGSFLAVLKRFGPQQSRFSFPMAGYTLALDFPRTEKVMQLMDRLDRITLEHGGRFYLAKDARLAAATLHSADPRARELAQMRRKTGQAGAFASLQSERLKL